MEGKVTKDMSLFFHNGSENISNVIVICNPYPTTGTTKKVALYWI
jgi:hypothetical protein